MDKQQQNYFGAKPDPRRAALHNMIATMRTHIRVCGDPMADAMVDAFDGIIKELVARNTEQARIIERLKEERSRRDAEYVDNLNAVSAERNRYAHELESLVKSVNASAERWGADHRRVADENEKLRTQLGYRETQIGALKQVNAEARQEVERARHAQYSAESIARDMRGELEGLREFFRTAKQWSTMTVAEIGNAMLGLNVADGRIKAVLIETGQTFVSMSLAKPRTATEVLQDYGDDIGKPDLIISNNPDVVDAYRNHQAVSREAYEAECGPEPMSRHSVKGQEQVLREANDEPKPELGGCDAGPRRIYAGIDRGDDAARGYGYGYGEDGHLGNFNRRG